MKKECCNNCIFFHKVSGYCQKIVSLNYNHFGNAAAFSPPDWFYCMFYRHESLCAVIVYDDKTVRLPGGSIFED
jgi:hypothetical protein